MGRRWLQTFGVWTCEMFELSKDHWHEPKWQRNDNLDVTRSFWTHREISTHARMRTLVKLCTQTRLVLPLTQDSCNSASLNSQTLRSFSACHQEDWEQSKNKQDVQPRWTGSFVHLLKQLQSTCSFLCQSQRNKFLLVILPLMVRMVVLLMHSY